MDAEQAVIEALLLCPDCGRTAMILRLVDDAGYHVRCRCGRMTSGFESTAEKAFDSWVLGLFCIASLTA